MLPGGGQHRLVGVALITQSGLSLPPDRAVAPAATFDVGRLDPGARVSTASSPTKLLAHKAAKLAVLLRCISATTSPRSAPVTLGATAPSDATRASR
jgi:hypothetical protein